MDIVNEEAKWFTNCENKEKVLGYLVAVRSKYFFTMHTWRFLDTEKVFQIINSDIPSHR